MASGCGLTIEVRLADHPEFMWRVAHAIAEQLREIADGETPSVAARLREVAAAVDSSMTTVVAERGG